MVKFSVSAFIILVGICVSIWVQMEVDASEPLISDFKVASSYKPVDFKTGESGGKNNYEFTTFIISDREFYISDSNPYYVVVLSALEKGGKIRVWYNPNDSSQKFYQFEQDSNIVAPFEKLLHINGYSGNGAAAIPALLSFIFVFCWYLKNGT